MTAKVQYTSTALADDSVQPRRLAISRQFFLKNIVWVWLIGLVITFGFLNDFFWSTANFQNILTQATVLGLLSLASAMPLLAGEIDLSVAGNLGISSCIGALVLAHTGLPTFVSVGAGVLAATAVGFVNGVCVTKLRMVSLIETLGMMIILQGGLLAITQGSTITDFTDAYTWVGQTTVQGWPVMPLALLVAFAGIAILLRQTVFGRKLYATGGNAAAANVAGIQVDRVKIIAFTLSGFMAGMAGYFLASWQMAITSDQGEGFLLYSIAAPIIGGVSVFGGRGNVIGILGGVLLLTIIHVGLSIVNVPSFYVEMIGGFLIFIAVAIDALRVSANSKT